MRCVVDGKKVGEQIGLRRSPEQEIRFFDIEYKLAADLLAGRKKIPVRFEAAGGRPTPSVFAIRTVRSDMDR